MMQEELSSPVRVSKINILPTDDTTIPLPSEECEEAFHLSTSSQPKIPLLDDTTAKRRAVLNRFGHGASPSVELPKGENIIRLPSD